MGLEGFPPIDLLGIWTVHFELSLVVGHSKRESRRVEEFPEEIWLVEGIFGGSMALRGWRH
jgi:hypothetical protein